MDAPYEPPPAPPKKESKSYTWVVVIAVAVLLAISFFVMRALKPKAVGAMNLRTTNLPGLTIDLPPARSSRSPRKSGAPASTRFASSA